MGDVGNYGADSEAEQFLQNNEGTHGYEGMRRQSDTDAYRTFAKEQIIRDREGEIPRNFKQFKNKRTGSYKSRDGFRKMKADVERKGERKQSFGEKQARLAKVEGVKL